MNLSLRYRRPISIRDLKERQELIIVGTRNLFQYYDKKMRLPKVGDIAVVINLQHYDCTYCDQCKINYIPFVFFVKGRELENSFTSCNFEFKTLDKRRVVE